MRAPVRKTNFLLKPINNIVVDLPAPLNLSTWWNVGSLLGLCLIVQILTGLFLSIHYTAHIDLAFSSTIHIIRDTSNGWLLRALHRNGASLFFVCLYLHIGRGIYYGSYLYRHVWNIGIVLFFLVMATAFLGYVLPWGQMSFWGATVITNLLTAIPYVGTTLVEWVWGGFRINNATLTRFFTFHFLLPFVILGILILHLLFLHETGSNNPTGLSSDRRKVPFHWYYSSKDFVGFIAFFAVLRFLALFTPQLLAEPENFIPANSLVTPKHIQPEWYFLFAYAILRSIPNKLGGTVALAASVGILLIIPLFHNYKFRSKALTFLSQTLFWWFICTFLILTWVGARPVEAPYVQIRRVFTVFYFAYFVTIPLHNKW